MPVQPFDTATLPATRWKNGGGSTREIVCQPPDAGTDDFDWRASIATISAPGPFSAFSGVDRVIMLLAGDGVRLRGVGVDHRLDAPLGPFAFSGDLAISCDLLGGASTDFNLMTRRGRCRAELQVLRAAGVLATAPAGLLLAIGGAWQCTAADDPRWHCPADGGLWWQGAARAWQVAPAAAGAVLIAVRIRPTSQGA